MIDGVATNAGGVFRILREAYVDDEKFRQDFEYLELSTSGQGRHLARYILCRLESDASGADIDFETDSGTIEHILPENPADEWFEGY
ncbi:MAG: HNH endonuclease, partial [Acidobacteria bacterium]|nr:HNH endonuclease [Acidobacteriota bacterium]